VLKPPNYYGILTTIVKILHSQPLFANAKYFLPLFDNISTMKPLSIPFQHKHIIHETLYKIQIAHRFHEISIHIGKLCNLDIIIDAPLGLSSAIDDKKTLSIFNCAMKSKSRARSLAPKMKKRCESFRTELG